MLTVVSFAIGVGLNFLPVSRRRVLFVITEILSGGII